MKYLRKLFLALKEIFIMMILQYAILILCILTIGMDKSVIWGSILLLMFQVIYIICKSRNFKLGFRKNSYFPYILLGIGIATVYNMLLFKLGLGQSTTTDFPIILNIICSGIVGPIYEEVLFRYDLIKRLESFNSNKWVIILLASIIFGLCHTGITTIIYAIIVGTINSYIYIKDKDIMKPIMVHMAGNIFVNLLTKYNVMALLLGTALMIISYFTIRYDD